MMGKISKKAIRKAKRDQQQSILIEPPKAVTVEQKTSHTTIIAYTSMIYYCPFCLHYGQHRAFEMTTAKGKQSKKVQCPECHNIMLDRTLMEKLSVEQYAEWVFMYRLSGFWQKCPFEKWKGRLYKLGMAKKFWEKYKLLKGTANITEYSEEYMEYEAYEHDKQGYKQRKDEYHEEI